MTREDENEDLIPAPIQTDMFALDGGFTMPWIRWFQRVIVTLRRLILANVVVARFKLPGVQVVGNRVLDTPLVVRCPAGVKVLLFVADAQAKTAPASSTYQVRPVYSRNNGTTYTSLLTTGASLEIVSTEKSSATLTPAVIELFDGDLLDIDIIAADGTVAGVEVTVRGTFVKI